MVSEFDKLESKANDLLYKDFNPNAVTFESKKVNSSTNVIKINAESSTSVSGKVEVTNFFPKYDTELIQSLSTSSAFKHELRWMPRNIKGFEVRGMYNKSGLTEATKSAQLTAKYSSCCVNSSLVMQCPNLSKSLSLSVVPSVVFGCKCLSAGFSFRYDASENALRNYSGIMSYDGGSYLLSANYNNKNQFGVTAYQRLDNKTEVGVSANLASRTFSFGGSYDVSPVTNVKASMNSKNDLQVLWTQKYNDAVTFKLSSLGNLFENSASKFGVGVVYSA